MAAPCLLPLTASTSDLSIPVDLPAVLDPAAILPPEIAMQQVQVMASIVLALLSEPLSEYRTVYYVQGVSISEMMK